MYGTANIYYTIQVLWRARELGRTVRDQRVPGALDTLCGRWWRATERGARKGDTGK